MLSSFILPIVSFLVVGTYSASTFSPARPPAIPLAVRSPYLNSWLEVGSDGGDGGNLAGEWPTFWQGQITGWAGQIRVDGVSYTWMGLLSDTENVDQTSFEYTATKSTFIMSAGPVQLNVTFDSPLFPNDLKRQSLVFSYLNVAVQSLDGAEHEVQVYADISAEWVSGDRSDIAQWDFGVTGDASTSKRADTAVRRSGYKRQYGTNTTSSIGPTGTSTTAPTSTYPAGGIAYHKIWRQTQLAFTENTDQTEFGYWYWATDNTANTTYQSGVDDTVRGYFRDNGFLADTQDTDYRAINDDWPVFAFSTDLGSVGSSAVSTLFSIGLAQEYPIQFAGDEGTVSVPSLWTQYFSDDLAALSFFHSDYTYASGKGSAFDSQLLSDATAAGGDDYYIITALSARQAFGATQLCGNTSHPYMFLKEISSDGNVNTVDVIFPMHPILLYSNPTLLKYLLDPLYENQEAGLYPNTYSMHDLGTNYPNATGHPAGNDEMMPLEECGNMLIMTLAYAQRASDNSYLSQHYALLQQWTSYLIDEALIPASQISTDDFAGALANQTNLALKGIIGIQAMAQIANRTNHMSDAQNYSSIAHNYINQWYTLAAAGNSSNSTLAPHTTLSYGNDSSYGLLYNLFADRELGLGLVKQSIYDQQSAFYPTVELTYGVPLDTRHTYTKLDWEVWVASIASESTQQMFFSTIVKWINATPTNRALTDLYDADTGDYPGIDFVARPVVGGTFALLTLNNVKESII